MSAGSFVPGSLGFEKPRQPRIARGRFVQHGLEAFEVFLRQSEVTAIKQDAFCFATRCLQHKIREIAPQDLRCAINQ